jgi:hypothetical protein
MTEVTTRSQFEEAVAVNGQVEFEEGWSFLAYIFVHIYFVICRIETFFVFWPFMIFIRPFLKRTNPRKHDPRRWPVAQITFTSCESIMYLKRNATTWKAIEYLYNWLENTQDFKGLKKLMSHVFGQLENIKATRNRLRLVKQRMYIEIDELLKRDDGYNINIVSLASGSARASIEVVSSFLRRDPYLLDRFYLYFVDADEAAFPFAADLARDAYPGLETKIRFTQMKISCKPAGIAKLRDFLMRIRPQIVETVGFGDYMKDEKAKTLYGIIHECLADDGLLLTNNVKPNHERRFLETVGTWRMINRSEKKTRSLIAAGGFLHIETHNEPCNIQPIFVARKAA